MANLYVGLTSTWMKDRGENGKSSLCVIIKGAGTIDLDLLLLSLRNPRFESVNVRSH